MVGLLSMTSDRRSLGRYSMLVEAIAVMQKVDFFLKFLLVFGTMSKVNIAMFKVTFDSVFLNKVFNRIYCLEAHIP